MELKKLNKILLLIVLLTGMVFADISGTVFKDGNGDGVIQSNEPKVGGVTVDAYDSSGNKCGTAISVSNASPNYTIAGCSGDVRLEFKIPTGSSCGIDSKLDFPTAMGDNSKSAVQFTTDGSTDNDFGVLSDDAYVRDTNPVMFTSVYISGTGKAGSSSDMGTIETFKYNSSGVPTSQGGAAPDPTVLANTSQVGSVWGSAYSKQAKKLFVSAFLKRHTGMGPDGSGAIYMINPATNAVTTLANLDALGFPTQGTGAYVATEPGFSPVIGSNEDRGLKDDKAEPSNDTSAFGQVGKVSLGDIDISSDGRYLYVVNLFDRKLYQIDMKNPKNPQTATKADVKAYNNTPWLTQTCSNGVARAFGTKYYRGSIYVGVVCTGENGNYPGEKDRYADDLRAYIYKVDPSSDGSSATVAIEFPLNYDKETVANGDGAKPHGWYPWTDKWSEYTSPMYNATYDVVSHPQPILADIEIDQDGSFILSFMDRGGHQSGIKNADPHGNFGNQGSGYIYVVGGDILKTYLNPQTCKYSLESNGKVGPYTSTALDPQQYKGQWGGTGPSSANGEGSSFTGYYKSGTSGELVGNDQVGTGKEFYWGDYANIMGDNYPAPHHNEGIVGGLGIYPSSGEVMVAGMDPVDDKAWSGGVYSLDNAKGKRNNGYNLYTDASDRTKGYFSKANGMGDIEIVGEIPPLERL